MASHLHSDERKMEGESEIYKGDDDLRESTTSTVKTPQSVEKVSLHESETSDSESAPIPSVEMRESELSAEQEPNKVSKDETKDSEFERSNGVSTLGHNDITADLCKTGVQSEVSAEDLNPSKSEFSGQDEPATDDTVELKGESKSNDNATIENSKINENVTDMENDLVPWGDAEPESPFPDEEKSPIFEERLSKANELKETGNTFFKSKDFEKAIDSYKRALYHVDFDELSFNFELMDHHREQVLASRLPLYLNSAVCKLQMVETLHKVNEEGDSDVKGNSEVLLNEVINDCTEALKSEAANAKALYRRAVAHDKLGNLEKAKGDIALALKVNPDDTGIRALARKLRSDAKEARIQSEKLWKGKLAKAATESSTKLDLDQSEEGDNQSHSLWSIMRKPFDWLLAMCRRQVDDE